MSGRCWLAIIPGRRALSSAIAIVHESSALGPCAPLLLVSATSSGSQSSGNRVFDTGAGGLYPFEPGRALAQAFARRAGVHHEIRAVGELRR